jgi:hypothetical protein
VIDVVVGIDLNDYYYIDDDDLGKWYLLGNHGSWDDGMVMTHLTCIHYYSYEWSCNFDVVVLLLAMLDSDWMGMDGYGYYDVVVMTCCCCCCCGFHVVVVVVGSHVVVVLIELPI